MKPIGTDECSKFIRALKPTKKYINAISTIYFVDYHRYFVNFVTEIINYCFQKGDFHNVLKKAIVTPFFKKEDPFIPSTYKPIALLPFLSKVAERSIYKRFLSSFEKKLFSVPLSMALKKAGLLMMLL